MEHSFLKTAWKAFENSGLDERDREKFVLGFAAGYGYAFKEIKDVMSGKTFIPDAETR